MSYREVARERTQFLMTRSANQRYTPIPEAGSYDWCVCNNAICKTDHIYIWSILFQILIPSELSTDPKSRSGISRFLAGTWNWNQPSVVLICQFSVCVFTVVLVRQIYVFVTVVLARRSCILQTTRSGAKNRSTNVMSLWLNAAAMSPCATFTSDPHWCHQHQHL